MKKFVQTNWFKYATYLLLVAASFLVGYILLNSNATLKNVMVSFFEVAENRSFDYRQTLKATHRQSVKPNKNIVVLAIDDASLESLWDKYGEWPIPREVYANVIEHIEQENPRAIVFDLLFIKSMKSSADSDAKLISLMNKYDNIYTGMNFDAQPESIRKPINLPDKMQVRLKNNSSINIQKKYSFANCRPILEGLMNGKVNVGVTNIIRSDDGIIRKIAPLMYYKGNYYPYLAFKVGSNIIAGNNKQNYFIDKDSNLVVDAIKIPLTKDGDTILNWYGPSETHTVYPLHKVISEIESNKHDFDFKDKIVLVGTTAMSLQDTKSVPVQDEVYPGVEVHATFINNMLDNNFIKQSSRTLNILLCLAVIALVGVIVMLSTSTLIAILSTILFALAYLSVTYYIMEIYNLWVPVVIPTILVIISFTLSLLAKYLIKSKDFEYQYKLATIDGLTNLYNHRYFQDSLKNQVQISERYEQEFSLIITDIDFFKQFNDTYGHQAGDAVLRQVADELKSISRSTDIVCRYGGEEMSIILPNTNKEEAYIHAKRIIDTISAKEFVINANTKGHVTVSVGVATFPSDANNAQDLIEIADRGLYYAKEHGRNQVGRIQK